MNSMLPLASNSRASRSTVPPPEKYPPLQLMLKMRFGAEPVVDVKMPCPAPVSSRSSQCGNIAKFIVAAGRHALVNVVSELLNCRLPLEIAFTVVNGVPKKLKVNGRVTGLEQSSQLLPGTSAVPGSTVAPDDTVAEYPVGWHPVVNENTVELLPVPHVFVARTRQK